MHKDDWKCSLVLAFSVVACSPTGAHDESYESQQSYLTISPTAVYQINSAATGKCIGIAGNSTANNAAVEARTCNGSIGQNFTLASVATGYYAIKNTNSSTEAPRRTERQSFSARGPGLHTRNSDPS